MDHFSMGVTFLSDTGNTIPRVLRQMPYIVGDITGRIHALHTKSVDTRQRIKTPSNGLQEWLQKILENVAFKDTYWGRELWPVQHVILSYMFYL